jgi:hypothetical protein
MEEDIIKRAKWLYFFNGGQLTTLDCVKQSLRESYVEEYPRFAIDRYLLFQITEQDYILYLKEKLDENILWGK